MAVSVGPSPFGDYSAYQNFKRATKKQSKDWTLKGWKKPAMRNLTDSKGNSIQVPEDDYQDYMTFYRSASDGLQSEQYKGSGRLRDVQTPADYVDYAFGKNTKVVPYVQEGVGHIKLLEYAPLHQVLRVTFTNNGSIVAFFRVPKTVAATLMTLAQTGQTRTDGRHLLGVYFWDLIRIRGTVHGSRYKFEYVLDNSTGGLPGRPYGSGENFYKIETGPDKTIQAKIDALKKQLAAYDSPDVQRILEKLIAGMREGLENEAVMKAREHSTNVGDNIMKDYATAVNMLDTRADSDERKKMLQEELASLEGKQHDVTRRVRQQVLPEGSQLTDPTAAILATVDQSKPLSAEKQRQLEEVARAMQHFVTPAQRTGLTNVHNAERRNARSWDNERVSQLAEQLARENKLGKGGIELFNTHFPNATEQFDYLKHRGFIPADARYIN